MPPNPKHAALTAYAIVLPCLLTSPIWFGAFGLLKLMRRIKARIKGSHPLMAYFSSYSPTISGLLMTQIGATIFGRSGALASP
jgi:hypothetical protein